MTLIEQCKQLGKSSTFINVLKINNPEFYNYITQNDTKLFIEGYREYETDYDAMRARIGIVLLELRETFKDTTLFSEMLHKMYPKLWKLKISFSNTIPIYWNIAEERVYPFYLKMQILLREYDNNTLSIYKVYKELDYENKYDESFPDWLGYIKQLVDSDDTDVLLEKLKTYEL